MCQWRPDVHVDCAGSWIVVLRAVDGIGEGAVGIWYVTEEGPVRLRRDVLGGGILCVGLMQRVLALGYEDRLCDAARIFLGNSGSCFLPR